MRCPFCRADDTKVVDSRLTEEGDQVRRRRECLTCSERFTTYEGAVLMLPRVVKGNGDREEFDEEKLRRGLQIALQKRPVDTGAMEAAINRIKHNMRAQGEREVSSKHIGRWVMDELRDLDRVAYVRFASVYLGFDDLNAFREEFERLEHSPTAELKKHQLTLLEADESNDKGGSA
jgi:transcriptional repressor NrdR